MQNVVCCMLYVVLMFFSIFFVHSKILIIFAVNILKPIMRRTYHSDLSQAITKMPPPISESPQAEGSWSHQRLRLTEMTFALLERVIDTAQRLGLQLNPREQSILIASRHSSVISNSASKSSTTPLNPTKTQSTCVAACSLSPSTSSPSVVPCSPFC